MTARVTCCVPHCRRTLGLRKGADRLPIEWVCAEHWKAVPAARKSRHRQMKKRVARIRRGIDRWAMPLPGEGEAERVARVAELWATTQRLCDAAWIACRDVAIERAFGI